MPSSRFRLQSLLAAITLALLAACTPAATPTVAPPEPPTTAPPTLAPSTPACTEEVVWPQLSGVQPAEIAPGGTVTVTASGGYRRCGDAYNESARDFALTLGAQPIGTLSCYVNHCQATLVVPADAAVGEHV